MVGGRTILVCGGRRYSNQRHVFEVLDKLHEESPIVVLVQGDGPGADALARRWAQMREIDYVSCPAKWSQQGKPAGPIRNSHMLDWGPFDLCIAFPGGDGTADMVKKAREAGIPVMEIV